MTAAFDRVWRSVSPRMNGDDDVKQTLALIILRYVDRGERDIQRLANRALCDWTGIRPLGGRMTVRSAARHRGLAAGFAATCIPRTGPRHANCNLFER